MRLRALALSVALLSVVPAHAWAQGSLLQGGPQTAGHVPMYATTGTGQAVVQDAGAASGGGVGLGLSELLLTARGTGTAPYAGQGTGPLGTNQCSYDAPTTNATGYHYFCLSPNAQGGGLIAYGSGGGATALPFTFNLNGTAYQFPFATTGIVGPATTVVGDIATWNNTSGTLVTDSGILATSLAPKVSPSFTTPSLGVATATSINGLTITSTTGTLTLGTGTNNLTGLSISGTAITAPASGLLVGTTDSQTLTNKTLTSPTINGGTITSATLVTPTLTSVSVTTITASGLITGNLGATITGAPLTMTSQPIYEAFTTLSSASTTNIGAAAGNYIQITGSTTINAFDTVQAGVEKTLEFSGTPVLTNSANLILMAGANVTMAAGNVMTFRSEGSGNWRQTTPITRPATKTLMQAAADNSAIVTASQINNAQGVAKVAAAITSAGAIAGFNQGLASASKGGTATYTLTFSTAFTDTTYACVATPEVNAEVGAAITTKNTGSVVVTTFTTNNGSASANAFAINCFGNQ